MKCEKCRKQIDETFMGKIKGTYIKKKPYCNSCQKDISSNGAEKVQIVGESEDIIVDREEEEE